ncbi:MAG: YdgA family protein [Syntrophobacteraceae bacterium]
MKKTLTIILFVCLALIVAYGAAGYWVGGQAQNQHDRLIEQINRSNYMEASIKSYERGLFSSRALTTFTLALPEGGNPIKFSIINHIYHGPFVFLENPHLKRNLRPVLAVIQTRLAPGDSGEALQTALEKIPELESSEVLTVLSIDGSGESYFDVPSFRKKFQDEKGEQVEVEWSGFTAQSKFDALLGEVTGSYSAPSLEVTGQDQLLRVKDIQGDFNSYPGIKGISVGSTAFSIGSIEGMEKENTSFNLSSLRLKAESGVAGEAINGSLLLSFDKLKAGDMGVGPFAMEFEVRKLDAEVLARFQKIVPELRKKTLEQSENDNAKIEKQVTEIMTDLLAKSPEFEIKQLTIRTDKGDLSGRANLTFASGKNPAENVLALLGGLDASAELSVSEALLYLIAENVFRNASAKDPGSAKTGAHALVMGLMAGNYIISEGGSFKSSATFKHGVLAFNGHKLDLSNLP